MSNLSISAILQSYVDNLHKWFYSNKLTVSNVKSCCMLIGSSQHRKDFENCQHIGLTIASSPLNYFYSNNYLGTAIDISSVGWGV